MEFSKTLNHTPKKFLFHIQALYFFEEMYEPFIKGLDENVEIYILLDYDFRNDPLELKDVISRIEKFCTQSPKVVKVFKMEIVSKNKFLNLKNIRKLVESLNDLHIFLACELSSPEVRFLRTELLIRGAVPIFLQTAGLSFAFWSQYGTLGKVLGLETLNLEKKRKLLNFSKYPSYLRYVYKRFRVIFSDYLFRYIFSLIFQSKIYPRTEFCNHPYVVNKNDKMLLIYPPDKDLMNKVFNWNSASLIEPPYASVGSLEEENKLLIAFPGPLSNDDQIGLMTDFFEIVKTIIDSRVDSEVLVRFHPRDCFKTKELLFRKLRRNNPTVEFCDVSSSSIWNIMKQTEMVISGVSNMVPLSRVSSQTRAVVCVLNAGFHGIMGSNQLYRDIPDVNWVSNKNDISWAYIKKKKFRNLETKRESIYEALNRIYSDTKINESRGLLKGE